MDYFIAGEAKIETRVSETKDKSGKITRETFYSTASKFTAHGQAFIKGPMKMAPVSEKDLEEKKKRRKRKKR